MGAGHSKQKRHQQQQEPEDQMQGQDQQQQQRDSGSRRGSGSDPHSGRASLTPPPERKSGLLKVPTDQRDAAGIFHAPQLTPHKSTGRRGSNVSTNIRGLQ